jgi:aminopeptidase N
VETLLRDFYQRFKYQTIMTEDVVEFFNAQLGRNLTPIFDQYLRRAALPTLELAFVERGRSRLSLEGRRARVRHACAHRRQRHVAGHRADD